MHELSLAQSLVEQIEEVCQSEGATRVVRIDVEMGDLSGVEKEPFEFAFPIVSQGTVCDGAQLEIEQIPVEVTCSACGASTRPEVPVIVCMSCYSNDVSVTKGRDFKIKSMEVS